MLISSENVEIRDRILDFEKRIDDMHIEFYKYYTGEEHRLPDMQRFERELLMFSRKRVIDIELSQNLDRVLYKFQNRKRIWLSWAEEAHHRVKVQE